MTDALKELLTNYEGLDRTLGITFTDMNPEEVRAEMPVTPRLHQPIGYLHGGANVALAESVASVGSVLNIEPHQAAFGMEINANHLRSVREGTVTAVGKPLHRGRSSQVWEIKIYDEAERLVCVSRCTVAVVERRPQKR